MASTFTPCLGLEKPAQNDYAATGWAAMQDANHDRIDQGFGQGLYLNVGAGGIISLTAAQAAYGILDISGNLTGDAEIIYPSGCGGRRYIRTVNTTFNGHSIYVRAYEETTAATPTFGCHCSTPYAWMVPFVIWPGWRAMWADYGAAPPGTIIDYAVGGNVPHGWMICDGHGEYTLTHDLLFSVLGYAYGGSGTTFQVPDLQGRVTPGCDNMSGISQGYYTGAGSKGRFYGYGPNNSTGQVSMALGVGNLPSHNHGINDPGHNHGINDPGHNHFVNDPGHNHNQNPHSHGVSDPGHSHTYTHTDSPHAGLGQGGSVAGAFQDNTGSSGANISIQANNANINPAVTGAYLSPATTGISDYSAGTGVSTQNTGSGSSFQTVQPSFTLYKLIRC